MLSPPRAGVSEVFAELQHDSALITSAIRSGQRLEVLPLSTDAYTRYQDALSGTLPYHASRALYAFYSFAREVNADPSGLVGRGASDNFLSLRRELDQAINGLAPYVG